MNKGDSGPTLKTPIDYLDGLNEKGAVLFVFRPRFHILNIIAWIVLGMVLLALMVYLSSPIIERAETIMFGVILLVYPLFLFILYIAYISVFEDIVIFERGFYPPITSEGTLNTLLMRRTFIPFAFVEKFDIGGFFRHRPSEMKIKALGQTWYISHKWNIDIIAPIIQTGIDNLILMVIL